MSDLNGSGGSTGSNKPGSPWLPPTGSLPLPSSSNGASNGQQSLNGLSVSGRVPGAGSASGAPRSQAPGLSGMPGRIALKRSFVSKRRASRRPGPSAGIRGAGRRGMLILQQPTIHQIGKSGNDAGAKKSPPAASWR